MTTLLEQLIREDFTLTDATSTYVRTAEHDSLVLDRKHDCFYWNSQGISGNAFWYLVKVRGLSFDAAKKFLKGKNFSEPFTAEDVDIDTIDNTTVVQSRLVNVFYTTGMYYREYWYNERGYTDQTIERFKLGYTGEWYTIPIFVDGIFRNFQVRRVLPDGKKEVKPWYRGVGHLPFNFSILRLTNWVIIAEGPADAIMLRQHDLPAVSHSGGAHVWNPAWNVHFGHIKKFFVVYDNDVAGNEGAVRVAKQWGGRANIYNFWDYPEKYDVTDYFKNGGNSVDFLNMIIENGKVYYEVDI